MTVNKFGHHLNDDRQTKLHYSNTYTKRLQIFKNVVDFEDRILRNVRGGVLKGDVITKQQLEESINFCLTKIKTLDRAIEEINKKINSGSVSTVPPPPPSPHPPGVITNKRTSTSTTTTTTTGVIKKNKNKP